MLSPVRATVFSDECPEVTMPSNGTFSPGLITIISPIATCSGFMSSCMLPRTTWAMSGRISIRCAILSLLFPSAYPSKSSPTWKNSITKTASGNCVSALGRKPMHSAPMVAIAIRKCSLKASPSHIPSHASSKVSCPINR